MTDYFNLLQSIANEYYITKGIHESEQSWLTRVVYSYLGQVGYASLWDVNDDMAPTSEVHFKRKIDQALDSMVRIFPELISEFPADRSEVGVEILDTYLATGCVYHEPWKLTAPVRKEAVDNSCRFYRGQALDEKKRISGLGCYTLNDDSTPLERPRFSDLFLLQTNPLETVWQDTVASAQWSKALEGISYEYLRCCPPFTNSYWIQKPDLKHVTTLARIREESHILYYLCRIEDSEQLLSPLPAWMTDKENYRAISNGCLATLGNLPPTRVHFDGNIVYMHIDYLYPPDVLNAIRLYSWPDSYYNLPRKFHRIMSVPVFLDLQGILEPMGYRFQEE